MTRMSCNGCRVLRKGCSDGCTIRPCLEWIKSPEAQANATVFLAKFYGRAGLLNLLAAGSDASLRPALFRSLLYEACGRMANPTYGSVGLLWSGQWEACQAAVEAVLKGTRVVRVPSEAVAAAQAAPPLGLRAYDIRHVSTKGTAEPLRVSRAARTRFKRASSSTSIRSKSSGAERVSPVQGLAETERVAVGEYDDDLDRGPSHEESAGSHDHRGGHVDDDDDDDMAVEQTREESENTEIEAGSGSHVSQAEQSPFPPMRQVAQDDAEIELELTLGFEPVTRVVRSAPAPARFDVGSLSAESSHIGLRLELSA